MLPQLHTCYDSEVGSYNVSGRFELIPLPIPAYRAMFFLHRTSCEFYAAMTLRSEKLRSKVQNCKKETKNCFAIRKEWLKKVN